MENKTQHTAIRIIAILVIIAVGLTAWLYRDSMNIPFIQDIPVSQDGHDPQGGNHQQIRGGNNEGTPGTPMAHAEDMQHEESMPSEPVEVGAHDMSLFTTRDFSGSGNCGWCHTGLTDANTTDVSIDSHWRSTMMANAGKDPYWQAKVSIETARLPGLKDEIEAICANCHTPMAHGQAIVDGQPVALQNEGFLNVDNLFYEAAMDGVSCTLCHQIIDEKLGDAESFSGGFVIDTSTSATQRLAYGPYPNPFGTPMQHHTGFTPVQSPHVDEASLCATCHTLFTPYVDANDEIAGTFPEQTPYLEWLHSDYATTTACQGCHMPAAAGGVVISNRPRGGQLVSREPFYQHHFVGGNVAMLNVLTAQRETLGVTADVAHLDATLARTQTQLSTRAAGVAVTVTQDGSLLNADVAVSVWTGHKLPTAFPARRAWLYVTVTDADGKVVFSSGEPLADGRIAGCDADIDSTIFEPHYDVINTPDQVQVYESIMQNTDGEVTYMLLRAEGYIKDNRLLPAGFDAAAAGADFAVYGVASDADFQGGGDVVHYAVDTGSAKGPFTVNVALLYQSISYQAQQDLLVDGTPESQAFMDMFTALDIAPVELAAATVVVE